MNKTTEAFLRSYNSDVRHAVNSLEEAYHKTIEKAIEWGERRAEKKDYEGYLLSMAVEVFLKRSTFRLLEKQRSVERPPSSRQATEDGSPILSRSMVQSLDHSKNGAKRLKRNETGSTNIFRICNSNERTQNVSALTKEK